MTGRQPILYVQLLPGNDTSGKKGCFTDIHAPRAVFSGKSHVSTDIHAPRAVFSGKNHVSTDKSSMKNSTPWKTEIFPENC